MSLAIQIDAPYLAIPEYAKRTGQTVSAVTCQCDKGQLPVHTQTDPGKRGKRFINMLALYKQADSQA